MWGHCACGHDFGPLYRPLTQLEEPQEPPQPEEYLSRARINRLLWRLFCGGHHSDRYQIIPCPELAHLRCGLSLGAPILGADGLSVPQTMNSQRAAMTKNQALLRTAGLSVSSRRHLPRIP